MSALEELWLWMRGRSSQTETGPDASDAAGPDPQQAVMEVSVAARKAELAARVQRNARYRAGPWQMK